MRIARYLDLLEKWKMLASKLNFGRAIDAVEKLASNKNESPTMILLREWMLVQTKESKSTCYQRLINALKDMDRNDIIDDLEDFGDVDIVDDMEDSGVEVL